MTHIEDGNRYLNARKIEVGDLVFYQEYYTEGYFDCFFVIIYVNLSFLGLKQSFGKYEFTVHHLYANKYLKTKYLIIEKQPQKK